MGVDHDTSGCVGVQVMMIALLPRGLGPIPGNPGKLNLLSKLMNKGRIVLKICS